MHAPQTLLLNAVVGATAKPSTLARLRIASNSEYLKLQHARLEAAADESFTNILRSDTKCEPEISGTLDLPQRGVMPFFMAAFCHF